MQLRKTQSFPGHFTFLQSIRTVCFRSSVSTTGTLKSQKVIKASIPTAPANNHNANELKPTEAELAKKISAETESLLSQDQDCNV